MSAPPPLPEVIDAEEASLAREEKEALHLPLAVPAALRRNPGLALTALYLVASVIGILFHHLLLRRFGLNALDFSEATDFLMVVVREPLAVALALLGAPFYYVYGHMVGKIGNFVQRIFPRLKRTPAQRRQSLESARRWMPWVQGLFILTYAALFLMLYSTWRADRIKAGGFRPVVVEYKTDSPRADGSPRSERLALLGTTARFVFLYDPTARRTEVVPFDSIARLSWDARTRREREAESKATRPTPAANPPASSPAVPPPPSPPASPEG